ncbi:MAG: hypothetical protein RMK34_04130 [Tepidimonas sp.]|uniref:hypothetical protein n=1 Tax=Tepidimonas sp. TaxID=2002775 RepID=UPI00298ED9A4|nr:hypothetical protein [Tepidimonas sp.]MDW8336142.1 hypothetical protein [Tepidimonas sp.]
MVEVLVAVLLVSVALVGMAALQAQSLKNMNSTLQRTAAAHLIASGFEYIRSDVNPSTTSLTDYNLPMVCVGSTIPATGKMSTWLARYLAGGTHGLQAGTCIDVNCDAAQCQITVRWNDQKGSGGLSSQQLTESARLKPL